MWLVIAHSDLTGISSKASPECAYPRASMPPKPPGTVKTFKERRADAAPKAVRGAAGEPKTAPRNPTQIG